MLTTLIFLVCLSKISTSSEVATITIDVTKRSPISPYIYGINYPDSWINDWLKDWQTFHEGFTLAREGGNRFTAYNWETNASNAGKDYFFENDDYLGTSNEPGLAVRSFLAGVQATGAAALLTVPTLGFVAADKGPNDDTHRDVNLTPDYLHKRFIPSYSTKPAGKLTYPPDTSDHAVYQDEFVAWIEKIKSNKSPVWFSLDNEPDLWSSTHARIASKPWTYAQIIANNIEYAKMIKRIAPESLVFGPANYGWYGFRAFQGASDANGRDFVDTYLEAMRQASSDSGRRLLDVYDFHWYPEAVGGGVRVIYGQSPDKPETAEARIQSTRSLWDPSYVEDSWITAKSTGGKAIRLLPDFQERVKAHYPGTKLSISEYTFGGENVVSGAIAQADALGVFGRYGLFAACHWGLKADQHASVAGFRAFTDYDRKGSRFGDIGLGVVGEDPAEDSVYASLDSRDPNRMTLVVVNKSSHPKSFQLRTDGFASKTGVEYIVREGAYDVPESGKLSVDASGVRLTAPQLSITTIELRK